jgi:Protein of unknown function (DUF3237)
MSVVAGLNPTALMHLSLEMGPPVTSPLENQQIRRCVPIIGGDVSGQFAGRVLSGGSDWQTVSPDGTIEIDARYMLELVNGLVEVQSKGLRTGSPDILARLNSGEQIDPADYYFRTAIRFYTAAPALERLNHILAISTGERQAGRVLLTFYEVT